MQEARQEHQVTSIHFAMVEEFPRGPAEKDKSTGNRNKMVGGGGIRRQALSVEQSHFALPSVTINSSARHARERRERDRRRFTMAWTLRCFIFAFPLIYYKQISGFFFEFIPQTVITPTNQIVGDYSSINGIHDLSTAKVKPWCFTGVTECPCSDPLKPVPGTEEAWKDTHIMNQQLTQSAEAIGVDVVFLGDSITERWRETDMGLRNPHSIGSTKVFNELFSKRKKSKYNGLALGISGDTSPMLLWRLKHGELPSNLNPSVFWLLIGTNDIGRTWCSIELVVIGIIRNVEEILKQKPTATVVLNALFPRTFNNQGFVARKGRGIPSVWKEIKLINSKLKEYAKFRDGVTYFETSVFFTNSSLPTEELQIDPLLMPDFLHPSPKGYKAWGKEIVETLDQLITDR